jgi:hypothetical protein
MSTLPRRRPIKGQDDRRVDKVNPIRHRPFDVHQAVFLLAGAGIGAVLAIVLMSAWLDVGSVAATAIAAISAMVGGATAAFGFDTRRRNRDS